MTTTIFDKTETGRDEIATRAKHLPPRLRTLLLLVDGKRDTVELMVKVAGLGLDEKSLVELLEGGFIQVAGGAPAKDEAPMAHVAAANSASMPAALPITNADSKPASGPFADPVAISTATQAPIPAPALDATASSVPAAPAVSPATAPATAHAATAPAPPDASSPAASGDQAATRPGTASQSDINAANAGILREGETQFQALYNFFNETIRSVIGLRGFTMQLKVERAATIADFRLLRPAYLEAILKAKGPEMHRSLRDRLDQLLSLGD